MTKKITFDVNNISLTYYSNGNVNINPKFVAKWGYIDVSINDNGDNIEPKDFIFDCKGVGAAIKIE